MRVLNNSKRVPTLKLAAYINQKLESIQLSPSISQKPSSITRITIKSDIGGQRSLQSTKKDIHIRERLQRLNYQCHRLSNYFESQSRQDRSTLHYREISRLIQKIQMDQSDAAKFQLAQEEVELPEEVKCIKPPKPRKRDAKLKAKFEQKRPIIKSRKLRNASQSNALTQIVSKSNVLDQASMKSGFSSNSVSLKFERGSVEYQTLQNLPTETSKGLVEYEKQGEAQHEEMSYPEFLAPKMTPPPISLQFTPTQDRKSSQNPWIMHSDYRYRSYAHGVENFPRNLVINFNNQMDQSQSMNPPPLAGDVSYLHTPFKMIGNSEVNFEKTYMIMQESSADKVRMQLF